MTTETPKELEVADGAADHLQSQSFADGRYILRLMRTAQSSKQIRVSIEVVDGIIYHPGTKQDAHVRAENPHGIPHPQLANGYGFRATRQGRNWLVQTERRPHKVDVAMEQLDDGNTITCLHIIFEGRQHAVLKIRL